jgi:7-cyano-7-deazaguanine synthase
MLLNPKGNGKETVAVMYSGGIDSTVLCANLLRQGYNVVPMIYDDATYNFGHRRMIAIERLTQELGIFENLVTIRTPFLEELRYNDGTFGFVPGWKMILQVNGMAYCQKMGIEKFYLGYNEGNHLGGYGDEHPQFIKDAADLYNRCYGTKIEVLCPYFDITKADVIALGETLKVPFKYTNGCRMIEHGGLIHCGYCEVCHRRKEAFDQANVYDPTTYHYLFDRMGMEREVQRPLHVRAMQELVEQQKRTQQKSLSTNDYGTR